MNNLTRRELEWLTGINTDGNIVYIGEDFAIATDYHRFYSINYDNIPNNIENVKSMISYMDKFKECMAVERVTINPQYLMDALRGMAYDEIIGLSILIDNNGLVALQLDSDKKSAIIACIEPLTVDEDEDEDESN